MEIPWDQVALSVEFVGHHGGNSKIWSIWEESFLWRVGLMRQRVANGNWNIITTIDTGSRLFSSDSRDHVYAMLGMPAFRGLANSITPDYSKPIQELYTDMVLLSALEHRCLDALSFAEHKWPIHRDGFPSWVRQWDNPHGRHLFLKRILQIFPGKGVDVFQITSLLRVRKWKI